MTHTGWWSWWNIKSRVCHSVAHQGRRAVLLVVDGCLNPGNLTGSARYLSVLGAPLHVWTFERFPALQSLAATVTWGDISSVPRLGRANSALQGELSHQLVVWTEGAHLPQVMSVRPGTTGFAAVR